MASSLIIGARTIAASLATCLALGINACGSGRGTASAPSAPVLPTAYVLTVNSATPASGVAITVTPADNNSAANGSTSFTRTYNTGTSVTLLPPQSREATSFLPGQAAPLPAPSLAPSS